MEKTIDRKPYLEHLCLNCACGTFDHSLRFSLHRADPKIKHDETELFTEIGIQRNDSLWRRIRTAVRYIRRGDFCDYSTYSTMLDTADALKLRAMLDDFIRDRTEGK